MLCDEVSCCLDIAVKAFCHLSATVFLVGSNEDREELRIVAQDVVSTTSHDDAVLSLADFEDYLTLYLEEILGGDAIGVGVEEFLDEASDGLYDAMTLVVALEYLWIETTLFGSKIDYLLIVELALNSRASNCAISLPPLPIWRPTLIIRLSMVI